SAVPTPCTALSASHQPNPGRITNPAIASDWTNHPATIKGLRPKRPPRQPVATSPAPQIGALIGARAAICAHPRRAPARPSRSGPTGSIFMLTVVDQARPWLTPRSTFAKTTQPQDGARMISTGTGKAAPQPTSSTVRRPNRSASPPATKLLAALTRPKLIRNERIAARLAR